MTPREVHRSPSDPVLPTRVLAPLLGIGSLLCVLSLLVPGYVVDEPVARWMMGLFAVSAAGLGLVAWRVAPVGWGLFAVVVWADLATVILSYALVATGPGPASVAVIALPSVTVALFGTRRMLAVQALLATLSCGAILARSYSSVGVLTLQTLTAVFATISPAVAVLLLRERLQQIAQADRDLAVTDPLTGVANRRGLEQALPQVRSAARVAGRPVGVVVLDIDHFKAVNDRYGHAMGDAVLQRVAQTLIAHSGELDVVARLGGEEFAVVTVLGPIELAARAETLRLEVARASSAVGVTVSAGVAWDDAGLAGPEATERLWLLVDRADELMYAAKRAGRDRVRVEGR